MSMSKTVGATIVPVAKDVPVTPMLMKPVLLWRQPPLGLGDPWSWYCHRALTLGRQQLPTELLQGSGAGTVVVARATGALAVVAASAGSCNRARPSTNGAIRRADLVRRVTSCSRSRGSRAQGPFKYRSENERNSGLVYLGDH